MSSNMIILYVLTVVIWVLAARGTLLRYTKWLVDNIGTGLMGLTARILIQ